MSRLLLLALGGCAYEAPVRDSAVPANGITGEVVVNATTVDGPVYVLLYDAADPPPPDGTGRPINFAAISQDAFVGGAGVQSAPFALTSVPDGTYLVTALLDHDRDFYPLMTATAGSTCGDTLGAYLSDLTTGQIGTVTVEGGELAEGITVALASTLTLERPAVVLSDNGINRQGTDPLFGIASTAIAATGTDSTGDAWAVLTIDGPYDADAPQACDTFLPLYLPDDDGAGDGNPHPNESYAAQGLIEIWPRVYLQYLGDGSVQLEAGESYAAEAVWALPLVDQTSFLTMLYTGELAFNTITPVTSLDLYVPAAAKHTLPDGTEAIVTGSDMPSGSWAVTVVSPTGQTWTLPNELYAFESADATYNPSQQAGALTVE